MKIKLKSVLFTTSLLVFFSACAPARPPVPEGTVPAPQVVTVEEEQYGHNVLAAITERYQLDYTHPRHAEVERIVSRLTKSVGADKDPWHIYVFADPLKNAAATRGNHVFIWTGMIDATFNESELAAVLAHEIGHVLARHTDPDPNEEMQKMLISVGALAAGIAASAVTKDPSMADTAGKLARVATEQIAAGLLVNPYSREREAEADHVGLFLMATAGYDPQGAIDFWARAQSDPSFGSGPSFLSTHPPADERLARLTKLLPRAQARFRGEPDPILASNSSTSSTTGSSTATGGATTTIANTGSLDITSTANNSGDSFDIRKRSSQSTKLLPPLEATPGGTLIAISDLRSNSANRSDSESWIVIASEARVFDSPSSSSISVGSLPRGTIVEVSNTYREWLTITAPQKGFLRGVFLEPLPK